MRLSAVVITCASTVVLVTACGAPSLPGGDDDTATGDQSATAPGGSKTDAAANAPGTGTTDPPATTTDGGTTTPATNACGAKPDQDACYECCEDSTAEISAAVDAEEAIDLEWKQCACASSRCATACATDYCAAGADPGDDPVAGSACETCLDSSKTDACDDLTDPKYEALEQSAGYVAWEKCDADSKCSTLPE